MADIHHVITLGIGTPSSITHFILVGLSPTGPVSVVDPNPITVMIAAFGRTIDVDAIGRVVDIDAPGRTIEIGAKP